MTLRSRAERTESDAFREAATHGGRLGAAMAAYPAAPRPWIDLSTGINPDPWKGPRASMTQLARLPDPAQIAQLEATAARAFGVSDPARVVATAGAEAGLRQLPRLIAACDIDIVSPTYSGHEAAWQAANVRVLSVTADELRFSTADAAVLVNPNNPDGHAVAREELAGIVEMRTDERRWTIVDESFVETQPERSIADHASDRLIVLRSFGKFYGLAGVRLGFVIAPPEIAQRLRVVQGEWPVSAQAIAMGVKAYADDGWRARTHAQLIDRASEYDDLLAARGLHVVGGTSLFRLVSVADAASIFDALCGAGVLARPFAWREDWLRFGLPRQRDLGRVGAALRQVAR